MNNATYQLHIYTPSCMKASLPVSGEVANYLATRLVNHGSIKRKELLQQIGYPKGIDSQSGSFLDSVYNFANAILAESNSTTFTVQIEAIPAQPKINPIFKDSSQIPKEHRDVTVIFKDKEIMSGVDYCTKCEAWHTSRGDIKVHKIHQWAYSDELYPQLNLPEIKEETNTKKERISEEMPKDLLKMLLLAALLSGKKSKSDFRNSPFNI